MGAGVEAEVVVERSRFRRVAPGLEFNIVLAFGLLVLEGGLDEGALEVEVAMFGDHTGGVEDVERSAVFVFFVVEEDGDPSGGRAIRGKCDKDAFRVAIFEDILDGFNGGRLFVLAVSPTVLKGIEGVGQELGIFKFRVAADGVTFGPFWLLNGKIGRATHHPRMTDGLELVVVKEGSGGQVVFVGVNGELVGAMLAGALNDVAEEAAAETSATKIGMDDNETVAAGGNLGKG
jgi:hypothetical protein